MQLSDRALAKPVPGSGLIPSTAGRKAGGQEVGRGEERKENLEFPAPAQPLSPL